MENGQTPERGGVSRVHLIISGDVIGVGFRSWARRQAQDLNLVGWVTNRADDTVELVADGPKEKLESLIRLCRVGPDVAEVSDIKIDWEEPKGEFLSFEVKI